MKRTLGTLLIAGLVLGASACGSSGGGSGANADVKAYCEAVDVYLEEVKAVVDDPAKTEALSAKGLELTQKAQALGTADLSTDDAETMGDCTNRSSEALVPAVTPPS